MTVEQAESLVGLTTFKNDPKVIDQRSSVLMKLDHLVVHNKVSSGVYTMLGELWLKKKRQVAIRHLELSFGAHISNHEEFQTFMISLNQNARIQHLTLNISHENYANCEGCTSFGHDAFDNNSGEFDFWSLLLFSPDLGRSLQKITIDLELSKQHPDPPI